MKKDRESLKPVILAIVIIVAIPLYILKINGVWDYSRRFDIQKITCSVADYDAQLMIDDETKTAWGAWSPHWRGETVEVMLHEPRQINGIILYRYDANGDNIWDSDVSLYYSEDGENWMNCNAAESVAGRYEITTSAGCRYIRIVYESDDSDWSISELELI